MKVNSILPVDDFCGSTFPTPKGGVLTVVGIVGKSWHNKKYGLICSKCHTDTELFPDYFETTKRNLVKGIISCGCSPSPKLNEQQRSIIVSREAIKRGHEFRGFVGGKYERTETYLIMYCPDHGEWKSSTYVNYMCGRGCPSCGGTMKIQNPEELITEEATKRGHVFCGFVGGKYVNVKTYLIMYCPEHGEWRSTNHNNYMNHGRSCPSCAENGYSQSKPGTFYIIHYEYEGEVFIKYGITNRSSEERSSEHIAGMKNVTSTILKEYHFEDGTIPYKMEQAVNTKYKGGVTTVLTSGNTETAPHYELDNVKLLAESVLKGI